MPSSKVRRDAPARAGKGAKKDVPSTKDVLFNNLKRDLDVTIERHRLVDLPEGEDQLNAANESLDAAAKKLFNSSRAFTIRT